MGKVYDSPANKGMLFPQSSGAGDDAITGAAEGSVKGSGDFVIGVTPYNADAPQNPFAKLKTLDGKA